MSYFFQRMLPVTTVTLKAGLALSLAECLSTPPAIADVQIKQAGDQSVTIKADTYNASSDGAGKFSLAQGDEPIMQQVFKTEAGSTFSVNIENVAI